MRAICFVIACMTFFTIISPSTQADMVQEFLSTHCTNCHNTDSSERISFPGLDKLNRKSSATWEQIVRKLTARQMPPASETRPTETDYEAAISKITQRLDEFATRFPTPGRTESVRRLTRTEYQNAIRDLLSLEIDATKLLPADESSHGFDNITVGELSPVLLSRYISAAQKIAHLAVGGKSRAPSGTTIRLKPDITQEDHVPGLPLGTRGGGLFRFYARRSGKYDVVIRLARDRNEHVEGLSGTHRLHVLLDRNLVKQFTVKPPPKKDHSVVDAHLKVRIAMRAGLNNVGVTFVKRSMSLSENKRQPFKAHYNYHRHPRLSPAIYQVSITGPYDDQGPGETASREQVFTVVPSNRDEEQAAAKQILSRIVRRAFRREINDDDLRKPMQFFREGSADGKFDDGIEMALASILTSSNFLFRVERDPVDSSEDVRKISTTELASRLSFFLWSSIPDEELLDLAASGQLSDPETLETQVRRMLSDARSTALIDNFASQWLYLRNLESITPDLRLFPDFDDNLRQSFRRETELFVASVLSEDRSVLDLLQSNYTFLNERLAHHYGIPHVYGSRFRRVSLAPGSRRGGLLRHASVLTVTSYATRTSPVVRGHWILKNLLGSEPPPPPADVPALKENTVDSQLPIRERLAEHRSNEACAGCHRVMDPIGFSLENFDAIGRWREVDAGEPIDSGGEFLDGKKFSGVSGLEKAVLGEPDLFVRTMTEKLMTYALGRGIEPFDGPAIRQIVRKAKTQDFRFSSLIMSVVKSVPFQMRSLADNNN